MTWHCASAVAAAAVAAAGLVLVPQPAAQGSGLTGAAQVSRAYDAIMDARFSEIPSLLSAICPPVPPEVCRLLSVVSMWWQIQQDPANRAQDQAFQKQTNGVIDAIERWTEREPSRAEAWFYLGGAVGARAQWRVLRGQTVAAARDGKRIKAALERALMLDQNLQDAYFGIGLYHYYAGVAPTFAKMLRWLLLLPGGNREQGLEEMLRARAGGQLLRSEADYQLHLVYLWYEKQPARALELITQLAVRYPHNPHFQEQIAEIEDGYTMDHAASLRAWEALIERAQARLVAYPDVALARARLGAALELDHTGRPEAAIPLLRTVIETKPTAPVGAEAVAHLQLAYVYDRLGHRDQAVAEYRSALAANPVGDPLKLEARARAGLRRPRDTKTGN
jgi:tetratricopeptide (TPR) repeat protein